MSFDLALCVRYNTLSILLSRSFTLLTAVFDGQVFFLVKTFSLGRYCLAAHSAEQVELSIWLDRVKRHIAHTCAALALDHPFCVLCREV